MYSFTFETLSSLKLIVLLFVLKSHIDRWCICTTWCVRLDSWYRSLVVASIIISWKKDHSKLHAYAKTRHLAMSSGSQKLSKFKRKTGTQSTRDYLLAQRTDLASSGKCSGILHGEGVLVQEPRDISELVHLGSYGKGVFSRSISTHHCLPQLLTDLSSLTPRSLISRSHAQQSANSRLHGLRSLLPTMSNDSACQHDRRHILHANSMLKVEK